eukprot:523914-Rhodomonas_salina.2
MSGTEIAYGVAGTPLKTVADLKGLTIAAQGTRHAAWYTPSLRYAATSAELTIRYAATSAQRLSDGAHPDPPQVPRVPYCHSV